MQQVINTFQRLLPEFVEQVSAEIVTTHIPVYETLPRTQVQRALYNAIHSLGLDLERGTTSAYANYWREVALQRARQGISPVHSMLVTNLSTHVMTSQLKQRLGQEPQALAWWLERMHTIISLGMLVMTEARINALRQLGQLPAAGAAELAGAALVGVGPAAGSGITILGAPAPDARWVPLHIQTLGQARVWRGPVEVTAWGRKSAVLLMGVLLTSRGEWLQREQICDLLWPEADPAIAEAQFKVALNALSNALEPQRAPRSLGRPLERRGSAYRIDPRAEGLRLDAARFEELLDRAAAAEPAMRAELLRRALALYQGDYLADCLYSDWAREMRERLRGRFLGGACALACLALELGRPAEAASWAEAALARDACCEEAYQVLLRVYAAEGNRAQVCRVYERCAAALWCELGLEPLPATTELYRAATLNP